MIPFSMLSQPNKLLLKTWGLDSINSNFYNFKTITANQKKNCTNKLVYTFGAGGSYGIEESKVTDEELPGKAVLNLIKIDSGKWQTKHLGETDFLELSSTTPGKNRLYEIRVINKTKLTLFDITTKGYKK